jgi:sodium-dependent phosphate cotransporter
MKRWLKLFFFLYLFILAIEIIKTTSLALAPDLNRFILHDINPIKAIATGWFTTAIVQSSGAIGSITAALAGNNILTLETAVYILIGASLGTIITALLISIITISQKRRDFRHGFEIGLCYALYSAMLVGIVFVLEFFFGFFSKSSFFLASAISDSVPLGKVPNLVGILTNPITKVLLERTNEFLVFIFGFIILLLALRYIGKSVINVFGGEEKARNFINRHFNSKLKIYFVGALLTAIIFSSSITISLLVPLAVARLINLKKAIPFILGAALGTSTDLLFASVIIGKVNALATFLAFLLFVLLGTLIFLPNTEFLFKLTKYTSKKLIHISRRKALYFLLAFILIPLILFLIL